MWLAVLAQRTKDSLRTAADQVTALQADVKANGGSGITAALGPITDAADVAVASTHDPVWSVASHLPVIGDDLRAVRTVADAFSSVATAVLPALGTAADLVDSAELAPDGRVDLAPMVQAASGLAEASAAAQQAYDDVAAIKTDNLLSAVAGPVVEARDSLGDAAAQLASVAAVARVLPDMLGADGSRTYLVLALNSAELRTAGGIVGAGLVLQADDGRISLIDHRSTADIGSTAEPVAELSDAEVLLHGPTMARWIQDTVSTPDFPRAALLASRIWQQSTGQQVDGVIATDPVALSHLLDAIGLVDGPDGEDLTADTIVDLLLRKTYLTIDDARDADAYFADVAGQVFSALAATTDRSGVLQAVRRSVDEGRVKVWSSHRDEQAYLATTRVGSAFLGAASAAPAAGLFLDDGTTGKLDIFLDTTVTGSAVCSADGTEATLTLDMRYDPPADIASLPPAIVGVVGAVPLGSVLTNVTVYTPVGGTLGTVSRDGQAVGVESAVDSGRTGAVFSVVLAPGESTTVQVELGASGRGLPVWVTPTATSSGAPVQVACG